MAENVFILGAGASFDAGAPLMNRFLDKAAAFLRDKSSEIDREAFQKVFNVISDLRLVHANSYLDLYNIEALFGAIEMSKIINRLGSIKDLNEINKSRESLIKLIVQTLEMSIHYGFDMNNGTVYPTPTYKTFVELLLERFKGDFSLISFNYDIALDYALHDALYRHNYRIDYCLNEVSSLDSVKLMKLHGSVNWGKCASCGSIVPYYVQAFTRNTERYINLSRQHFVQRVVSDNLSTLVHTCSNGVDSYCEKTPVIVPPTWNKTDYHGNLTQVWNQAANELESARNIFVIGYSLPETDSFFRYLYALGTFSNSKIERFWVFNPENSGETRNRYEQLIGQGIANRFKYEPRSFADAITYLRNPGENY